MAQKKTFSLHSYNTTASRLPFWPAGGAFKPPFHLIWLLASIVGIVSIVSMPSNIAYAHTKQPTSIRSSDYTVPVNNADPWGTAVDSSGRIWVALPGCDPSPMCSQNTPPGRIAAFLPSISRFIVNRQFPAGFGQALFLAFDSHGMLWFPMPMSNTLGRYNPSTHTFTQWTVPTPNAGPWDLAIDSSGAIWFTEHYSNKIGRFDPLKQSFTEITTPAPNSQPYGITIDSKGNVWFTENSPQVALIAEYTTKNTLLEYKIRNSFDNNLTPHLITADLNGNLWWSEGFVGMIGKLNVSQAQPGTNNGVSEYAYPQQCKNCGEHTSGIAVDRANNIWFDDSLQSIFGFFPQDGSNTFQEFPTPTTNSHPHDGLMIDHKNHIWFDEEFANKLAFAVYSKSSKTRGRP